MTSFIHSSFHSFSSYSVGTCPCQVSCWPQVLAAGALF